MKSVASSRKTKRRRTAPAGGDGLRGYSQPSLAQGYELNLLFPGPDACPVPSYFRPYWNCIDVPSFKLILKT